LAAGGGKIVERADVRDETDRRIIIGTGVRGKEGNFGDIQCIFTKQPLVPQFHEESGVVDRCKEGVYTVAVVETGFSRLREAQLGPCAAGRGKIPTFRFKKRHFSLTSTRD
jgi:hypothetical protein